MKIVKHIFAIILVIFVSQISLANKKHSFLIIEPDTHHKLLTFGNQKIRLTLDYNHKAIISSMQINGEMVIQGGRGIYCEVRTTDSSYSTLYIGSSPRINILNNTITIRGINYGSNQFRIAECWKFIVKKDAIVFDVDRNISKPALVEEASFPEFTFKNINTWEGAFQGFGGLAWFYLFNNKLDTYGVHTDNASFWNSKTGNGLSVAVTAPGNQVAIKYTRTSEDNLSCAVTISQNELIHRYDTGINRTRFISGKTNVWAPFTLPAAKTTQSITLSYFDFNKVYGRGRFVGIDGARVGAILNTIARIGVIDADHFGGNSWHTPYGPICLQEQYIAQIGVGINDKKYLQGYQKCLDFYRDHAIKPDGRVFARWAYTNEDAMPGKFNKYGFYETQWGYALDSNPDFVTNVAELYDQTGDTKWIKTQYEACERALDWIVARDSDGNGLVEMMTDSHTEHQSSDWIDVVWASYEDALINAKLYHALIKWSAVEYQLGHTSKADHYRNFAAKLKTSFNKPISQGGFWDSQKGCYVHWLDKDKSVHGTNMVIPVNFMAIAYGICNDSARRKIILDGIENQMVKERLFFWPLVMESYARDEAKEFQFPFPAYENGDIFLSWGAVAVKAYAEYKPEIALKYVKNVLKQYSADGLAFQRYGRIKQNGEGDDILSGNCLSIVGLYQSVYGINPLYNRFYLNPHITPELAGTTLKYNFRNQKLIIGLKPNSYSVSNGRYKITSASDFGFYDLNDTLYYFNGGQPIASLSTEAGHQNRLTLEITKWGTSAMAWDQATFNNIKNVSYKISCLPAGTSYIVTINGKKSGCYRSDVTGNLMFKCKSAAVGIKRIKVDKI